jgi:hypothetical protein
MFLPMLQFHVKLFYSLTDLFISRRFCRFFLQISQIFTLASQGWSFNERNHTGGLFFRSNQLTLLSPESYLILNIPAGMIVIN